MFKKGRKTRLPGKPVYITEDERKELEELNMEVAQAKAEAARAAAIARSLEEKRRLFMLELARRHEWTGLVGENVVIMDGRFVPPEEAIELIKKVRERG